MGIRFTEKKYLEPLTENS